MSFRRWRGRFLIKLACRWSRIAGIESHFNLARQRPSKPNWRALLRRRLLPRAPARPYQTTPKSRTTRRSSLQTRLPSQRHRDLQPQHERVVRLVEPAGPNNVLDVRLDGKSPLNLKICQYVGLTLRLRSLFSHKTAHPITSILPASRARYARRSRRNQAFMSANPFHFSIQRPKMGRSGLAG